MTNWDKKLRNLNVKESDAPKGARLLGPNSKLTSSKNKINQYSKIFLSLEDHLANNLFVYNERSLPAKIQKQIQMM